MQLTLALIQMEVAMGDVEKNFSHAQELMEKAMEKKPDILVLPETWTTGFFPKETLSALADSDGHRTQSFLSTFARTHHVHIVGGTAAVKEGDAIYNRSYIYGHTGSLVSTYDKIHGFSLSGEPEYFQGGSRLSHFHLAGLSCSMAVCYDVRFPELIRREALQGVDLFFLPAAWPKLRQDHWITLNRARAIENQFYLAAVNQGGLSGGTPYAGSSMLINPWGQPANEITTEEAIITAILDTAVIAEVREKINTYGDRKPEIDMVE